MNSHLTAMMFLTLSMFVGSALADPPRSTKSAEANAAFNLSAIIKKASRKNAYRPVSVRHMHTLQQLFEATFVFLGGQSELELAALQQQWTDQGWRMSSIVVGDDEIIILSEFPEQRGGGCYAIRRMSVQNVLLQAPHSYADSNTRQIAAALFLDSQFRAAAWNTCHRKTLDVAHTRIHPFNAFMQAAVATAVDTLCMQLHGFDAGKRKTYAAKTADLILSDSTSRPPTWVRNAATMLQSELPHTTTRLFPNEVHELGAQTNSQSQLLRVLSSRRFLHFEMNADLRKRMLANKSLQSELLKGMCEIFRFSLQ